MLTSHRQKKRLERLRQLEQLGFSMPFEFSLLDSRPCEVTVEQCESELECPVMDLPDGQTLFIVWLSLWAERPGVRLYDFRFEPPWRDRAFLPLPSFADSHIGDCYCLPYGPDYEKKQVLNLNFLKAGWRLPSTRVEGVLCALSDTPIPKEYRHGATIPVAVKFFDRAGQQLAVTTVTLWADRLTHRRQKVQHPAEGRTVKPRGAPNAIAEPSVNVQRPLSRLYGPPGGDLLPTPDSGQKKGVPLAGKVREGGHGTGLYGG
jgi:hypothetical protein